MRSTITLVNLYFWKTFIGPFFAFGFPVFYTFIMCSLWDLAGQIKCYTILPGCFVLTIVALCLISLPTTINDLRSSILFKRMSASPIKPWMLLLTLAVYYYFIIIIAYCWQAFWSIFILWQNHGDVLGMLQNANYVEILFSSLMVYLLSLMIGLASLSFCRRNYQIQILAIAIIVISIPLAGLGVPLALIHHHGKDLRPSTTYVVYANPFWYINTLHYESWFAKPDNYTNLYGSSIFDFSSTVVSKTYLYDPWNDHIILNQLDKTLNVFLSLGIIVALSFYNLFTFKWNL